MYATVRMRSSDVVLQYEVDEFHHDRIRRGGRATAPEMDAMYIYIEVLREPVQASGDLCGSIDKVRQ